jgi:hypothetical protein
MLCGAEAPTGTFKRARGLEGMELRFCLLGTIVLAAYGHIKGAQPAQSSEPVDALLPEPEAPVPIPQAPVVVPTPPLCVGTPPPPVPNKRISTCCMPPRELLRKPITDVYPALGACYEARANAQGKGRVVFNFRIEQDGNITQVCSGGGTDFDDPAALRCMLEVVRKVHYPSISDESRDFCGLISLNYPVIFAQDTK